jgi:hypothetical protein
MAVARPMPGTRLILPNFQGKEDERKRGCIGGLEAIGHT